MYDFVCLYKMMDFPKKDSITFLSFCNFFYLLNNNSDKKDPAGKLNDFKFDYLNGVNLWIVLNVHFLSDLFKYFAESHLTQSCSFKLKYLFV